MDNKTLEQNLKRLEEIVDSLENGLLSLEDSITLYTEGVGLSADCKKQLSRAEQVVEKGKKSLFPDQFD